MTVAQEKWMASNPTYEPMSSWRGPYRDSGILFPDGRFTNEDNIITRPGCAWVGIRRPVGGAQGD